MSFLKGQKVVFLNEQGGGVVLEVISIEKYLIEDEEGFERTCLKSELAPVYGNDYKIDDEVIRGINEDETFATANELHRKGKLSGSRKKVDVWELDLHIEELTDTHSGWSNTEIVNKQMLELRSFYNRARSKQVRKLVIIHGVGTGVLKEEVREFLRGQGGVEFYDADYREYGKGATVVEIRYKY